MWLIGQWVDDERDNDNFVELVLINSYEHMGHCCDGIFSFEGRIAWTNGMKTKKEDGVQNGWNIYICLYFRGILHDYVCSSTFLFVQRRTTSPISTPVLPPPTPIYAWMIRFKYPLPNPRTKPRAIAC